MSIPFQMPAGTMRIRCLKNGIPESDAIVDARLFLEENFPTPDE
jgi:hypothetical protein